MKRIISIICSMAILIASVSFVLPTFAATGNSIDAVVEELSELYQEEAVSGKNLKTLLSAELLLKQTASLIHMVVLSLLREQIKYSYISIRISPLQMQPLNTIIHSVMFNGQKQTVLWRVNPYPTETI